MSDSAQRVALVQMVSGSDPVTNLNVAIKGIQAAKEQGARLVVLPENFLLFNSKQLAEYARSDAARAAFQQLAECAAKEQIWVLAGTFPSPAPDGRVYARSLLFDEQGRLVAQYDKRHLFDVDVADAKGAYRESSWIAPGEALCVVQTPLGQLGLSICYDLRFPGHFQRLRSLGAELICVPSAFTEVTGAAHWEVLVRARAIENQCYILGAGQGGDHGNNRLTFGHSMIVDPWGEILAQAAPQGFDVICAEIDLSRLAAIRAEMPVSAQRRDPL